MLSRPVVANLFNDIYESSGNVTSWGALFLPSLIDACAVGRPIRLENMKPNY